MDLITQLAEAHARNAAAANPYLIPAELGGYIVTPSWEALGDLLREAGMPWAQDQPSPPPMVDKLFGVPIIIYEHAPDVAWVHDREKMGRLDEWRAR